MNPLDPDPSVRYPALAAMRSACPVHDLAPGRKLALSHAAVGTALRTIDLFGGSAGQDGLPEDDTMIAGILEPRHGQVRRIINSVVALHRSQQIEPYLVDFIGKRMAEVLDAARDGNAVDVMRLYADPLPPAAMARLFGFPEEDSKKFASWGEQVGEAFGRAAAEGRSISLREAGPQLASYVDERIAARRAMPEDSWPQDALTRFLTTEVDGLRLTDRAICTQIMFSIGAGTDTTRNTLGSLLFQLADDPELFSRLRADRALIEPVIEESLRRDPPAQFLVRRCLGAHAQLDGVEVDEGDTVIISIAAANRDDMVFAEPDAFRPERPNLKDHLSFGTGSHICPGSSLARLELRLALGTWCDSVESFAVEPGYEWQPPGTGMLHGPVSLPLLITPSA